MYVKHWNYKYLTVFLRNIYETNEKKKAVNKHDLHNMVVNCRSKMSNKQEGITLFVTITAVYFR